MIINYPDTAEDDKTIFDVEEEGRCNLVLIAVRYTGPRSSKPVAEYRYNAGWPGGSPLQALQSGEEPGPAQGALVPDWLDPDVDEDRTVEYLEADEDIEVFYQPEDIAREMLATNFLDDNVFGPGYEPDLRERVFDALGLEDIGIRSDEEYRAQLYEIAGIEPDEETVRAEARDDQRVSRYRREHTREELISAAAILGHDDPHGHGRIELSTWLADQDAEAVRFAFEGKTEAARQSNAGDDVTVEEPLTAADVEEDYDHDEIKAVVKTVREGTGEFSLRGATTEDMAVFLADDKGLTEDEIDAHLTE